MCLGKGFIAMGKNQTTKDNNDAYKNTGTFIVKVDGSERGTWHGKVVWADENRSEHFRSTLELIKMIDKAVGEQQIVSSEEDNRNAEVG